MLTTWKKISEEVINRNSHWAYKRDKFEIPGRKKGEYHYVHTEGSTLIIPVLSSGKILLVNQYRYLVGKEVLEFPCGVIEPNLTKEENAIKELREETGFTANEIFYVGEFIPYSGVSDEISYVFIAKDLQPSPLQPDDTEEFELVELTVSEFEKMIPENKIIDGMTLAAWQMAKEKVKKLLG